MNQLVLHNAAIIIECIAIIKQIILPDIGYVAKQYYIALKRAQYVFESIDNIMAILSDNQVHALIRPVIIPLLQTHKTSRFKYVLARPHSNDCLHKQYIHFSIEHFNDIFLMMTLPCNCNVQMNSDWHAHFYCSIYLTGAELLIVLNILLGDNTRYFRTNKMFGERTWI